jgi:hypothetical protein
MKKGFRAFLACAAFLTIGLSAGEARAQCRDPWVGQAIQQVAGRAAVGSGDSDECDYRRYGGGSWNSYTDLVSKVQAAGVCTDPWISRSYRDLGRTPAGWGGTEECNTRLYGGGSWGSYDQLKGYVQGYVNGLGSVTFVTVVIPGQDPQISNSALGVLGTQNNRALPNAQVLDASGNPLIGKGGAGIVAAGGGNIVAAGGGNIVAAGGGNFTLQSTNSAPLPGGLTLRY